MIRARTLVILSGVAALTRTVMRHVRRPATGRTVPGGTFINDAVVYDTMSRLLLGSLFRYIADDVAEVAPDNAQVLEVGCGPGHLSIQLARRDGLDVTGLDLDPAMIEHARANADSSGEGDGRRPAFLIGNVTSLPFPDESFDLVVSTLSMHHWANPTAGLIEIGRVLRPGGRALVWDFRPSARPHPFAQRLAHLADPVEHAHGSPLRVVSTTPWRWPWRFNLIQRIELVRP